MLVGLLFCLLFALYTLYLLRKEVIMLCYKGAVCVPAKVCCPRLPNGNSYPCQNWVGTVWLRTQGSQRSNLNGWTTWFYPEQGAGSQACHWWGALRGTKRSLRHSPPSVSGRTNTPNKVLISRFYLGSPSTHAQSWGSPWIPFPLIFWAKSMGLLAQ